MKPISSEQTRQAVVLTFSLLLVACSSSKHGAPRHRHYAQSLDSASNSCGRTPSLCTPTAGERTAVIPTAPPLRLPPSPYRPLPLVVASGLAVVSSPEPLDAGLEARIKKALAECADEARSQIMLKHFPDRKDKGPTHEECDQLVDDGKGNTVTRAMQLGNEQHGVALLCTEQQLRQLKPGGFSLQPRYQRDPQTGQWKHMATKTVEDLLRQNKGVALRGSIEPDIVLHSGKPHQVQAVFDFKFPCVNTDKPALWRRYPKGHAHHGRDQDGIYQEALGVKPARVQPRLGVIP